MPFGSEGVADQLGLALSGGGFRATLFHVGSVRRLVELGILAKVGRISSISGGSINAGRLAQVWTGLAADPSVDAYEALVGQPLREFCTRNIDVHAIADGLLSPWSNAAGEVEDAYSKHLFDMRLDQLPDNPVFVINATNMQTGRSFRFTKKYMGDYTVGLIYAPRLPVARAVAASSAFPPVLSPVIIDNPGKFVAVEGAIHTQDPAFTMKLYLCDGGAYDNLGLETVWKRCSTLLVSDAGAPFGVAEKVKTDLLHQTMRALDIATDQSRGLRKRALIEDYKQGKRGGTYWGIDTDIANYDLGDALHCKPERVAPLAAIRTRLNRFNQQEQGELINWGYALADAAIRKHAPHLADAGSPAPTWPEPEWALDR
ncbi:MAG: patatin-like phospholipase family protein [Novosphingobium sp.]